MSEAPAGTVVGLFLDQAAQRGEAPFLHGWSGSGWKELSWEDCRRRVLRIGAALAGMGVRRGEAVILLAENRVEWILADLGIQAAGAVTVPIYPTSMAETMAKIAANCEAKLAIAGSAELATRLPRGLEVVLVESEVARWMESEPQAADRAELEHRLAALRPSDVASIIYTSGTTGAPKGVVLPHSNFVEMARATLRDFAVGADDSLLSFLPFSHVFERQSGLFIAIIAGAQIWVSRGLDNLAEDIAAVNPTLMLGVPRMFEKIVDRIRAEASRQPAWKRALFGLAIAGRLGPFGALILAPIRRRVGGTRLRMFVSGGSPLSPEAESFFWALGIPIFNGWGMTETTSGATANTPTEHRLGTVGRALPGVELKLDRDGELLVRGPGVLREYSRDPDATKESLDGGWLRTGDIATIDSEGFVRITDRKKDLLKTSGGKFVAPQPIEAALQGTRCIETAVLIGDNRPYVTALLVPKWDRLRSELGLEGDPAALVSDERVLEAVRGCVEQVNARLAHWETVKHFRLLARDFEEAEDLRTPSLKIKRAAIRHRYEELIDQMYAETARRQDAPAQA